ncbi:hypothetical protein J6590_027575 [Homalodisca vitripennis]|nr:hypothetical protein J6590_027575 [Homalodisca vitripennis]
MRRNMYCVLLKLSITVFDPPVQQAMPCCSLECISPKYKLRSKTTSQNFLKNKIYDPSGSCGGTTGSSIIAKDSAALPFPVQRSPAASPRKSPEYPGEACGISAARVALAPAMEQPPPLAQHLL